MSKKKISGIVTFVVLIVSFLLLLTGCPQQVDSYYGVKVTGDRSGGAIAIYEDKLGGSVYIQKVSPGGEKMWGEKGILLGSSGDKQGNLSGVNSVADGAEGIVVTWVVPSEDRYRPTSHLAKIDANRQLLWQRDFIYFDQMINDGSGGVIIAFDYPVDIITGKEVASFSLVKVDAQGEYPWTLQGVSVPCSEYLDNTLQMVSDGSGGVIIAWEETHYPADAKPGETVSNVSLHTRRINDKGELLWGDNGTGVMTDYDFPKNTWIDSINAVEDKSGGMILSWFQVTEDPSAEPGHRQTWDVVVQRIDADGNIRWQPGGVPVEITKVNSAALPMEPALVGDGKGGAIVIWRDTRHDDAGEASIYAQRVDENADLLWRAGGVKISSTSLNPHPEITNGGPDEAIISYSFMEDGKFLNIQKVGGNGQVVWQENGITITKDGFTSHSIAPDGLGGVILGWGVGKSLFSSEKAFIQRVSADGKLLWGEKGIRINR